MIVDIDAGGGRPSRANAATHPTAFTVSRLGARRAAWTLAALLALAACGGGGRGGGGSDVGAGETANILALPIEVLGDGSPTTPVVAEARLSVDGARLASVTTLAFECHRCGYFGAPEFEATTTAPPKVKASVRVLGGVATGAEDSVPWVDITDANVTLPDVERLQGGLDDGGFYTTHVTLALPAEALARLVALPATNRVQFRFNGTEGETNGFRVLSLKLQDGTGASVDSETVAPFDPTTERDPTAYAAADATAGEALWHGRGILAKSAIVSRKIDAACSSCHAENGRDLQYFNYSNNAIVQRARFHGLSPQQGRQIVAYLRTSLANVPYVAQAAPWNPPYQPGPGLDCDTPDCATRWSAGAGLGAVLTTSAQAVQALFGKAPAQLAQADIDAVMDPRATLDLRETAIPLQLPDWNAWLPAIHPSDVWPAASGASGSFDAGATFSNGHHDPAGQYEGLIAWLTANANPNGDMADWSHLTATQRAQIMQLFTIAGWDAYNFLGGGRGDHLAPGGGTYGAQAGGATLQALANPATVAAGKPGAFTTNAFIERAVTSMLHWNAVKQWQLAHDFQLEGDQRWFIGRKDAATGAWAGRGEAHGWPFNAPSAFYLAPHMDYERDVDAAGKVTREWIYAWQADNAVGSWYHTNQWYQLQLVLDAGAQSNISDYPVDWAYQTGFEDYLGRQLGTTAAAASIAGTHDVRMIEAHVKEAQFVDTTVPVHDASVPFLKDPGMGSRARFLTQINPGATMGYERLVTAANALQDIASPYAFLDDLAPGLQLKVLNGTIHMNNLLYLGIAPTAWRRCDPANTQLGQPEPYAGFRWCVDPARVPLGMKADGTPYVHFTPDGATTSEWEQYGVWRATQMGAEPGRLKAWSDWVDGIWPAP